MNKIYKVIWSKAKNCYVVASELAKSHTKAPTVGAVSRTLVAGVLASVVSCGAVMPLAHATQNPPANSNYVLYIGTDAALIELEGTQGTGTRITNLAAGTLSAASTDAVNGAQLYALSQQVDGFQSALSKNSTTIATVQSDVNRLKTSYLNLNSNVATLGTQVDTGFNVNVNGAKAKTVNPDSNFINFKNGTGIAVSNDGGAVKISLATDGAVASGNGSAITGGTAYTELRPADGNYVARANTTATNLAALDTQVKANADAIALETTNRTTAVNNEATARENADTDLTNKIGAIASNGNYITKNGTVFANLSALDTRAKTNADAIASINANAGALTADGNYILKDNTIAQNLQALDTKIGSASSANGTYAKTANTVNANIKALDTQLKTTTDNLAQEVTNRTTAVTDEATTRSTEDTKLSNRIGTVASDGNYIKASSSKNVAENLGLLDTQVKANANSVIAEVGVRESADNALSGRVGEVAQDKTYIKASSDTDIAGNLELLDDALTATDANLAQEISDRETADTALTNKIGAIASNGNYITKDGTVFANLSALDTRAKANADAISQEVTDRTTAVANEATARSTEDTKLSNRIGSVDADGSYIKASSDKNVGENLVLLDTQLKSVTDSIGALDADGNYVAVANTVNQNIKALDTRLRSTVVGLNTEVTNRTQAVNDEAFARSTEDNKLSNRIGTVADGEYNYIHASSSSNVAENLVLLDTSLKNTNDTVAANKTAIEESLANTVSSLEDADEELSDRIGTVADSGNYIQASSSKNVAENLGILDTKLKVVEDALETAGADFATAIGELSVDGTTIQKANNVSQNLALLDTALKATNDNIGVLASNGNYIVTTNTVYQNVSALDAQVKNINTTLEDVVSYDGGTHAKATLAGFGGTTLSNVKAGALNASSTDAVNGAQLYATNQNISGFATDINRNKTNIQNLNVSVTAALESVSTTSELVDTINNLKADASLNNLTAAGRQVIASAAANAVQEYMAAQNGTSGPQAPVAPTYPDGSSYTAPSGVYEVTTGPDGETVDGSFAVSPVAPAAPVASVASAAPVAPASDDGDASSDASAVSTPVRRFAAPMVAGSDNGGNGTDGNSGGGLRSVSPSAGTNYVVYDDSSAGTITLEGATGTGTKITNVADGELSAASTDAVNGGQLYAVTQQFDDFQSALSRNNTSIARAQTDINNIKTTNLNLQSQVQTLNTQVGTGLNVTVDGALVKNMNPNSNFVNFTAGDNIAIANDNGSVKVSALNDGVVRSGDEGLVSGDTVYNAIQNAIADSEGGTGTALAGKVNTDASNVGVNASPDNSELWGQALGSGEIADGNGKLVTGDTVYRETRVASDGNYIRANTSAGGNLSALDTAVKANADDIASLKDMSDISTAGEAVIGDIAQGKVEAETRIARNGNYVTANTSAKDNFMKLDTAVKGVADDVAGLKDLSNITNSGKNVIRGLAQGAVKVVPGQNTGVTVSADGGAVTYAVDVATNGTVAEGDTGIVTGGAVHTAINEAVEGIVAGTAVTDELANAIAQKIGNGAVEAGNTGLVTGGTIYDAINERMGNSTVASGVTDGTAYGDGATVNGNGGTAVGNGSTADGDNSVAVGKDSEALGDGSVAIGNGSTADGDGSVALGNDASADGNGAVAIGDGSSSTGAGATAIGQNSTANGDNTTAIGANSTADGTNALAVGAGSSATGDDSTAVGTNSTASADRASAFGNGANAGGIGSTAVGTNSVASADGSSAFGENANAGGVNSSAFGANSDASANGATAIGYGSSADGVNSTALGLNSTANSDYSIGIGDGANATGEGAIAIGHDSAVNTMGGVGLGSNASVTGANSVALGADSVASEDNVVSVGHKASDIGPDGNPYGSDLYRKIVNVADGDVSEGSHDAVNGGQLWTVTQIIGDETTAREEADTALGNRIGTVASDGEVIRRTNNMAQNLTALDTGFRNIKQSLNTETANRIMADNELSARIGTLEEDGTVVLKDNNVSANLKALNTALDDLRQGGMGYDDETRTSMTLGNGETPVGLHNVADGVVAEGSKDAVNGGQLHQTNQRIDDEVAARERAVNGLSEKIGTMDADGSFVRKDASVNDNLNALDRQVKTNGDAITEIRGYVDGVNASIGSIEDDIEVIQTGLTGVTDKVGALERGMADKVDKDASNIDTAKWLAKLGTGKNQANDKGLVNGDTLYRTVQELHTAIDNSTVHGVSINSVDENDTNFDSTGAKGDNAMALGVSAEAQGEDGIAIGHGSKATGLQSIALGTGNEVTGDHSGAFGDPNTVSGTDSYAFGNDNTVSGDNTFVLGNNVANATGNNAVVLGNGSDGSMDNVVSIGSAGAERKIVHVADGDVSADSKEAVNGGQLFSFKRALEQAENIDADKWAEKLGTGEVADGDSNLVTGGTVYNAIRDLNVAPGSITEDFASGELHIGGGTAYDNVDTVNFAKSDGTSRVITGVATNPQDPSSAANVAYVDAVGQNIINGVNNEFTKVNDRMDKVGAGAAAMAGLVPGSFDDGEKWNFSAAVGNYRSATAGALGMFYKPAENVTIAVKGAFGNGENMVSGGVGIALSKGNVPGVTKAQLARAVNAQADKLTEATRVIQQMSAERQADRERIAELERKLSRLETAQKQ